MNKNITKTIIALFLIIFALGAISIYLLNSHYFDNRNPLMQESMIKCTLEWGRLAAFPESKTDFNIKTEGGSFTRAFRSSFYLSKVELEKWIKVSPGLQDAEITTIGDAKKHYSIKPGGNAQFAEATIDFSTNRVEIYVYWS